jgi:glycosyltransferase involved in cell wall biosynthesis
MKIGIIVSRLNVKGGTQRQALCLAREFVRMGHAVTLYTFKYDKEKTFSAIENIPVVALSTVYPGFVKKMPKIFGFFSRPSFFVDYIHKLRSSRLLAHLIDPETAFVNPHGHFSYRVCYYLKKEVASIPAIWMLNTMPLLLWNAKRRLNTDPTFRISFVRRMLYRLMDSIEKRKFISAIDTIMVLDDKGRDTVSDTMHRDAIVIRSGVDTDAFHFRLHQAPRERIVNLLSVAFFAPHRRFEDTIEGMAIVRDHGYRMNLSIIGEWRNSLSYYEMLKKLIKAKDLDGAVRFLGRISDEELIRHYQEDDIFLFCNHMHPWGLAVFEAMACGMPVIVSRGSGASEVLSHDENAFLVPAKNPTAIADALQALIDNTELYVKLSAAGREFVEKKMGWPRYAAEVLAIGERTIKNRTIDITSRKRTN